jgi:hypothetical protein
VDAQNDVGDTPLHLAVWFGNYESVKMLLEYSAPVNMLNSHGLDPYHNVMERSPLVKKQKLPSGLKRSLKLLLKWMQPSSGQSGKITQAALSAQMGNNNGSGGGGGEGGGGGGGDDEFHDCDEEGASVVSSPNHHPLLSSPHRPPPPPDVLQAMRQLKIDPRSAASSLAPPPDVQAAIEAAKRSIQGGHHHR